MQHRRRLGTTARNSTNSHGASFWVGIALLCIAGVATVITLFVWWLRVRKCTHKRLWESRWPWGRKVESYNFPEDASRLLVHLRPDGNHSAIGMSENCDAVRATFYPHRARPWHLPAGVSSNYQPWPPCPHSRMVPIPPCAPSH